MEDHNYKKRGRDDNEDRIEPKRRKLENVWSLTRTVLPDEMWWQILDRCPTSQIFIKLHALSKSWRQLATEYWEKAAKTFELSDMVANFDWVRDFMLRHCRNLRRIVLSDQFILAFGICSKGQHDIGGMFCQCDGYKSVTYLLYWLSRSSTGPTIAFQEAYDNRYSALKYKVGFLKLQKKLMKYHADKLETGYFRVFIWNDTSRAATSTFASLTTLRLDMDYPDNVVFKDLLSPERFPKLECLHLEFSTYCKNDGGDALLNNWLWSEPLPKLKDLTLDMHYIGPSPPAMKNLWQVLARGPPLSSLKIIHVTSNYRDIYGMLNLDFSQLKRLDVDCYIPWISDGVHERVYEHDPYHYSVLGQVISKCTLLNSLRVYKTNAGPLMSRLIMPSTPQQMK